MRYFIDDQKICETYRPGSGEQNSSSSLDESLSSSFNSNQTSNKKSPFFSINSSDSSNPGKTKSNFSGSMTESFIKECTKLIHDFTHPYLKALFNFLINKEKSWMDILVILLLEQSIKCTK